MMSSHCIAGSQHFAAFPVQSYSRGCNLGHTCNATRHLLKHLRCRAEVRDVSTRTANPDALFNALTEACQEYKHVPPSMVSVWQLQDRSCDSCGQLTCTCRKLNSQERL